MSIRLTTTKKATAENGVKILVHGPAKIGKTRLAATTGGSTVIISAERGLLSLSDVDIPVIEVKTLADVIDAYKFLTESVDARGFEWVALDSLSDIAEVVLATEKAQVKDPRQAYGALQDSMADLVRSFRDLDGKNVYMIAKQERVKNETEGTFLYQPMMPGSKVGQNLPYFFDEVFAYRAIAMPDGSTKPMLQTRRDFMYEAGDRSGKLTEFEEPSLAAIRAKIIGAPAQQVAA